MKANKKLVLACIGTALAGFGSTFFLFGGHIPTQSNDVKVMQKAETKTIPIDFRKDSNNSRKIDKSDIYMPQYKDINGVCGMAVNDNGEHVAIMSDGACPTNEALINNYGYQYESLTDTFRPKGEGDSCGTAHLVTEGARISTKDMAKLSAMARGDLEHVGVSPKGLLCPTQAELSDDVSNSVGVPVRFEYNNFDTNINGYPVFNVSESEYQQFIPAINEVDLDITKELSGTDVTSMNGQKIPKILITPESKEHCGGRFETCAFFEDRMSLVNSDGKAYQIKTFDGSVLPKFMMTRGAWDVCGGVFTQCDYIPDEENPSLRGTVRNRITHKQYTSKEIGSVVDDNEPFLEDIIAE